MPIRPRATHARRGFARVIYAILPLLLSLTGAGCNDEPVAPAPTAVAESDDVVTIPFFVLAEDGTEIDPADTPPETLLLESRKGLPVLAPDGHQLTWQEFGTVTGSVAVECIAEGTHVRMQVQGLIPNGVYTLWNVTFTEPGFDPTFEHLAGVGPHGPMSGSSNTFVANDQGEASLDVTTPPGPLGMQGSIGACALTDEFEWHIVGLYHMDGETYGPVPGPDGTIAEQFAFVFGH